MTSMGVEMNINKIKYLKKFKLIICIMLVLLLSINGFAAVVADNDGTAFVTKAEFETLKENFASQIDTYNNSIDNKIDGSIASYLAGIRIGKKTMLRSTLEACGQTYDGVSRKSYVFAGNDSNRFMARYNTDTHQYYLDNLHWNCTPNLSISFRIINEHINTSYDASYMYGESAVKIYGELTHRMVNNDGSFYPSWAPHVFLVDDNMRVTGFKLGAEVRALCYLRGRWNEDRTDTMTRAFHGSTAPSREWDLTFTDGTGSGGTSGMAFSTRSLNAGSFLTWTGWTVPLYIYTSPSSYCSIDTGKYAQIMGTNYKIYHAAAESISQDSFNQWTNNIWRTVHIHFDETNYGTSFAWSMPFGHVINDRYTPCFRTFPPASDIAWVNIPRTNLGTVAADSANDYHFKDSTGKYAWRVTEFGAYGVSDNMAVYRWNSDSDYMDLRNWTWVNGMLPVWKTNPMKDFRLLKNANLYYSLGLDTYYAKAPQLTAAFDTPGEITWVAKVQQPVRERCPGSDLANWGTTRIYFAKGSMDDLSINSSNKVKASNTKRFKYKKHGTTNDFTDCQSEVVDGTTCYYLEMEHDTYYDFKLDVDKDEEVYYMVCDMDHLSDYCIEVYEHPDYQISFDGE